MVAPDLSRARLVAIDRASGEASRVLDATFKKYLHGGPCPPNPALARAGTWGELDRLQAEAHARGHFHPVVVQRIDGSFSRAGVEETLYAIALGECVGNGGNQCLDALFTKGRKDPAFRVNHSGWGSYRCGYDGIATKDGIDTLMRKSPSGEDWSRLSVEAGGTAEWRALNGLFAP